MTNNILCFLLLIISIPSICHGQNRIEKSEDGKYFYDSQSYRSKELKVVLENSGDPLAMEYYNKYKNKRKLRKVAFFITGATLLITPLLLTGAKAADPPPPPPGGTPPPSGGGNSDKDISGYIIGGVIVAGVVTIVISSSKGKKNLDKAIEQFNEGQSSSLSIGTNQNGFGLNFSF